MPMVASDSVHQLNYGRSTITRPVFGAASVILAGIPWIFLLLARAEIRVGYLVIYVWMIFLPIAVVCSVMSFIRHERRRWATAGLLLTGAWFGAAPLLL